MPNRSFDQPVLSLVDPGCCIIKRMAKKNRCLFISVAPNRDKRAINFLPLPYNLSLMTYLTFSVDSKIDSL